MSRSTSHTLLSFVSSFLRITLTLNILFALSIARGQEKVVEENQPVYHVGQSPADRLKLKDKPEIEQPPMSGSPLVPPSNDNFANAVAVGLNIGSGTFFNPTNIDATGETAEPIHGAGTGGVGSAQNSIWYSFTVTGTRVLTVSTAAGGATPIADTVMSVYVGTSVSNLTAIAHNDDYPTLGSYSKITLTAQPGTIYYVAIDGYSAAQGTFNFSFSGQLGPANDHFANAESLGNSPDSPYIGLTGSTFGSTGEVGEPDHGGTSNPLNSIWYTWTAPADLSMTFETRGSGFDTTLGVYVGSALNALTPIAGDDDDGIGISSRVTFIAVAGVTYRIAIDGFGAANGNTLLNWSVNRAESGKQFDYDGDWVTDYSVFRPSNNVWYIRNSSNGGFQFLQWGLAGDRRFMGVDYDNDDKSDIGIWRPSNSVFYVRRSVDTGLAAMQWGLSSDIPIQGEFDADDRADFSVWRPSTGIFYVFRSESSTMLAYRWGLNGDKPAPGDYDGDGKTDFAVWRPSNGTFYIVRSSDGGLQFVQWGLSGDLVVPGDYDRDGKSDLAVYRPSTNIFYARTSLLNGFFALQWGISGDVFAPGDYDGNGYSDVCVWRPSDGNFYVYRNGMTSTTVFHWGQNGDVPLSNGSVY